MTNVEELAKERASELRQEKIPEAIASVSYTLITPHGYPVIFTMRGQSENELFKRMDDTENYMILQGYLPDIKKPMQTKLPLPIIEGEKCPLCNSALVKTTFKDKEGKDKTVIKCSTQKWDYVNKKQTGCSYTRWE